MAPAAPARVSFGGRAIRFVRHERLLSLEDQFSGRAQAAGIATAINERVTVKRASDDQTLRC
jgi:hypothetical protein